MWIFKALRGMVGRFALPSKEGQGCVGWQPAPRRLQIQGPPISAPLGWWRVWLVVGRQLSVAGGAGSVPAGQERL